ncbi:hypothetical protein [Hymenobacter amundsenii]|uniref:hypothetical protein n=1 Tax=Hymenobacter amundsenii TaxID=2006685 RepID=UPI000F82F0A7|nr:hypothetical protein [Hymenobacter amundsenii]
MGSLTNGCARGVNPSNSSAPSPSAVRPTNSDDLRAFIIKGSQPGGKLDFFTPIKGHEYDGAQIKPGVYSTLGHIALYKWGRAVNELGVKNVEEAYSIISELRNQAVGQRDKDYIKEGFNKE